MASKTVELKIQLQNAKSITDLDLVIKDINKELKTLDVNSEAFKDLAESAKFADGQLKSIKEDLRGISDEKQLDSIAKIGGSIAAGFSIATVAATAFGEQTEEQVLKAIKVATELTTVVSSIKPLMEGLSSTNRRAFSEYVSGLGNVITGFKNSATGAALFGTTARAALTSTGIGALLVGLGLLITHWSDLTDAIGLTHTASDEYFEDQQRNLDASKKLLDSYNESLDFQNRLLEIQRDREKEIFANRRNEALVRISLAKQEQDLAAERLNTFLKENNLTAENLKLRQQSANVFGVKDDLVERVKELQDEFEKASKAYVTARNNLALLDAEETKFDEDQAKKAKDAAEKKEKGRIDAATKSAAEIIRLREAEFQRQLRLLEAEGNKQREIFELRKGFLLNEISLLQGKDKLSVEESERLKNLLNDYKILTIEVNKYNAALTGEAEKKALEERTAEYERQLKLLESQNVSDKEKFKHEQDINKFKQRYLEQELDILNNKEALSVEDEKRRKDLLVDLDIINNKLSETPEILSQDKIEKLLENVQTVYDSLAGISQAVTDSYNTQLDGISTRQEANDQQFQTSIEKRKDLEEQLKNTQGEARQQILDDIEEERQKEERLAKEKIKLKNQEIKIKNRINQLDYINNVIQAAVSTAKAIQAAFTVPPPGSFIFATLTAVLSSIQTGIIVANKPQQIPTVAAARGGAPFGFTGPGGRVDSTGEKQAGLVQLHANEWVAPRWQVEHPVYGAMIHHLEQARKSTPMAEGGFSPQSLPAVTPDVSQFNSLTAEAIKAAVESANISVAVTEIRDRLNDVNVIEENASI